MPKVRFEITRPGAQKACLVGNFNDWDPDRHRMTKTSNGAGACAALCTLSSASGSSRARSRETLCVRTAAPIAARVWAAPLMQSQLPGTPPQSAMTPPTA